MLEAAAIILAGGKSSRMGENKALVKVKEEEMIKKIIRDLKAHFSEILVSVNDNNDIFKKMGLKTVSDTFEDCGPLGGIHAALTASSYNVNFFVACDMPFISGELASYLVNQSSGFDVTVPIVDGKYQPLFAVYTKECLKSIENQLKSGRFKITSFYDQVKVNKIDEEEFKTIVSTDKVFFNVNTPEELEAARAMVKQEETNVKQYVKATRWKAGQVETIEDPLIVESPLTVFLNEKEVVTLLCTPDNLEELAVGFLFSEGLLKGGRDQVKVRIDRERGMAWVTSENVSKIAEQTFLKRYITTGCGKGTTFYNVMDAKSKPVESELVIEDEKLLELMTEVQRASQLFKETGGVHLTALCSTEKILLFREDIGRHNALDKIVGKCFLDNISISDKVLFTTGRLSSEILLKVAKLGIPILVSRSAPTSLAVSLAEKLSITLIGFTRGGRFNVYTNEDRVMGRTRQ